MALRLLGAGCSTSSNSAPSLHTVPSTSLRPSTCVLRSAARRNVSCKSVTTMTAPPVVTVAGENKNNDYNSIMQKQMGWDANPYEYHFERGLYYHEVAPNLFCGSQPRNASDVDELARMGVNAVLNLQQDKDLAYWNVSLDEIRWRCGEVGIKHIRRPARDFDPHSLRKTLPSAVQAVHEELVAGKRVYVHCTAGLGRAPAVCIAYIHWFEPHGPMPLDAAYNHLTSIRPCGPKRDAIRGATFDLMSGQSFEAFERQPKEAFAALHDVDRYALQYRVLRGSWSA